MEKDIVAGSIKGFLIIRQPKTKKIKFVKTLTSSGSYWQKNVRIGHSRELHF